jgi:hypothetical protein
LVITPGLLPPIIQYAFSASIRFLVPKSATLIAFGVLSMFVANSTAAQCRLQTPV